MFYYNMAEDEGSWVIGKLLGELTDEELRENTEGTARHVFAELYTTGRVLIAMFSVADIVPWSREDNFLFLCDRKADMVISGGVNIYPAEIEAILIGLEGVSDCAVFGIPDTEYGEALGAAIETHPNANLTEQSVQKFLRENMAGYKVPKLVTFHDHLPREDSGKIFKRRLREIYWDDNRALNS